MADPQPSSKSASDSEAPDRLRILNFPTPQEPLREWAKQNIDPAVMIAAIEAMMAIARRNLVLKRNVWRARQLSDLGIDHTVLSPFPGVFPLAMVQAIHLSRKRGRAIMRRR